MSQVICCLSFWQSPAASTEWLTARIEISVRYLVRQVQIGAGEGQPAADGQRHLHFISGSRSAFIGESHEIAASPARRLPASGLKRVDSLRRSINPNGDGQVVGQPTIVQLLRFILQQQKQVGFGKIPRFLRPVGFRGGGSEALFSVGEFEAALDGGGIARFLFDLPSA